MEPDADVPVDTAAQPAEQGAVAAGKRAAEGPAEGEPAAKQATTEAEVKDVADDVKAADPVDAEDQQAPADETKATTDTDANMKDAEEDAKPDDAADAEDEKPPADTKKPAPSAFPLKLGPREFDSLDSCLAYFRNLLKIWPENTPLNEYEHLVLSDLLKTCHPRPRSKIGPGVVAFKTKTTFEHASTCFFACHEGGTEVDFSYLKCMSNKVGYDISPRVRGGPPRPGFKGGRGDGGGRGGRGRGRGGRGRGGRRGRGRGRS